MFVLLFLLSATDAGLDAGALESPIERARLKRAQAEEVLFGDADTSRCADAGVECLIGLRYRADALAAKQAMVLWNTLGSVAGVTAEHDMNGGFRGMIHLVPDLPVGPNRKHLEWVVGAFLDHDAVLNALSEKSSRALPYRWYGLSVGFYRSVKKRTPAAYAGDWSVDYNTNGTLNWGPDIVRELLFHEVFHLNDGLHRDWSVRVLGPIYDSIVKKCGAKKDCLAPWAPVETVTRGTWYAFLPANGVGEYAAELATRFYREQRAAVRGLKVPPFKCRTPENLRAWSLMSSEFFGGVDLVPDCPH